MSVGMKFFRRKAGYPLFVSQMESRKFGILEIRTSQRESKKMQIKLATTCNTNEQQDAKNNAELQTKWTKTSWKTF